MRFAYLSCDFGVNPFIGISNSIHIHEIVGALRRRGHDVHIFSSVADPGVSGKQELHSEPLQGLALEVARCVEREQGLPTHLAVEWRRLIYSEYVQRLLLPKLRRYRPEVIYERYSLFAYGGVELARELGVPLLLEVNAPLALEASRHRRLVLNRTAEELERRIFESADALLVVSRRLAEYAHELGVPPSRIRVVPNGANPDRFRPERSGGSVRESHGLSQKRVVGFVGTLRPWHDLETVLDAVALLSRSDECIHLLIVGEGPGGDGLPGLEARHVSCTGAVAYEDVPELMAAMDVVVVPYAAATDCYFSPLKLFEAMAMAKPVVGARTGQVEELLREGETGLLYEPGQARDLADRIAFLLGRPDRAAAMGHAAREWVIRKRTWDRNAVEIEAIAAALLAGRNAD